MDYGTLMESSGFSGARQQGDKKNAYEAGLIVICQRGMARRVVAP
jgi:hypothetical protein